MNPVESWLKHLVQSQEFSPSPFLGLLLNPFYFSRREIDRVLRVSTKNFQGSVLDVGCGSKPYQKYFSNTTYTGMEIEQSSERPEIKADVFYAGERFPFEDQHFDSVVSFQVLEHVEDSEAFMKEIFRVLKPSGKVLLTVPFVWEEHEVPYDRRRYTSYGLREAFHRNGFDVQEFKKLGSGVLGMAQVFTGMITTAISGRSRIVRFGVQLLFTFPVHVAALLFAIILPKRDAFYLDNYILATKNLGVSA